MHEPRGRVPCLLYWLKGAISSWRSESLRAPSRPRNCPLEDFTFFPCVSCLFGVQVRSLVCPVPSGQSIAPRLFGVQVRSLVCPVSLGKPITPCLFGVQVRSLVCPSSLGKPIAPCLVAVQARSLCVSRALFGSKLGLLCAPLNWASQSRPVWSRSQLGLSVCPVLCSSPSSVSRVSHFTGQANRAMSGRGPSSASLCVPFSVRVQARSLVCSISLGKPIAPCLVAVPARSLRVSRSLFESKLGLLCAPFHWASQSRPVWSRSKLGLSCVQFHWKTQSRPVCLGSKFGHRAGCPMCAVPRATVPAPLPSTRSRVCSRSLAGTKCASLVESPLSQSNCPWITLCGWMM